MYHHLFFSALYRSTLTKFIIGLLTKDFKLKNTDENFDILIHKGDFGIEPCAYILGNDAIEVADKLLKIIKEIRK